MILNDLTNKIDLSAILKENTIKASEVYRNPPCVMYIDDTPISTLRNFSASTGKAKAKKTFMISAMVAAALSGKKILQFNASLPPERKRILYIDTEQSRYHCHNVLSRILKMAGYPETVDNPNLDFISLREYSACIRVQVIEYVLSTRSGYGLVVIDGLRDLLIDINSISESVELTDKLMRWSSQYDLHIHVVIHLNKGDDNIRGHIGTELSNKAETVIVVSRNKVDGNVSEVHPTHMRDRDFSPFAFRIDDNGVPVLENDYNSTSSRKRLYNTFLDISMDQHYKALSIAFPGKSIYGFDNVIDALLSGYASVGFVRKRTSISKLLAHLIDQLSLIRKEGKRYTLIEDGPHKSFILNEYQKSKTD
jgi:hypothetical protein